MGWEDKLALDPGAGKLPCKWKPCHGLIGVHVALYHKSSAAGIDSLVGPLILSFQSTGAAIATYHRLGDL